MNKENKSLALMGCILGPCVGCLIGAIGIVVLALVSRIPLVSVGFGLLGLFYLLISGAGVGALLGGIIAVLAIVFDKRSRQ